MTRNDFNSQSTETRNSANVNVVVNDIRNNGGNYKWQIEKINVIKEFFNDDFFNDELGQYIEVDIMVNGSEVFPRVCFDGKYDVPKSVAAFQSSKKSVSDMVASMTEMIKRIAVEYGYIESDFYPLSFVSFVQQEQVAEQENEQEQDDAAIEYLREVMPVIPVDIISEKIDECVEDLCLVEDGKRMDFDKFCDVLWDDYVWDEVFTDEALENETREWMEFNDRVRYIIENEKENIFTTYDNEIVGEIVEKSDAPCLVDGVYYVNSEYDIDGGIERVADTIEKYLGSYTPSYLDSFGDCTITIYWDEFNEQDMKMLIENDIFAMSVRDTLYDRGVIKNLSGFLVYDDGVYVDVDYDKTFNKSNVLNTLRREYALCDDDVYEMPINTLADRCGGYHVNAPIYVMYDKENDNYYVNGTSDDDSINDELTSKTTYMELYDMITELLENGDNEFNKVA